MQFWVKFVKFVPKFVKHALTRIHVCYATLFTSGN
jgi:hypothetical protein